jgi:hypothetical protein
LGQETRRAFHKALGWGPWNVYEHKPPLLHSTELRGRPTQFTMLGAEVQAGPIVFELTMPNKPNKPRKPRGFVAKRLPLRGSAQKESPARSQHEGAGLLCRWPSSSRHGGQL